MAERKKTRLTQQRLTPEQDARLARAGAWVIETCLLFGAQRKTAYLVAGSFVEGVEAAWRKQATDG